MRFPRFVPVFSLAGVIAFLAVGCTNRPPGGEALVPAVADSPCGRLARLEAGMTRGQVQEVLGSDSFWVTEMIPASLEDQARGGGTPVLLSVYSLDDRTTVSLEFEGDARVPSDGDRLRHAPGHFYHLVEGGWFRDPYWQEMHCAEDGGIVVVPRPRDAE